MLIPNTLYEDELLKFTAAEKRMLLRNGLKVVDVPGKGVLRAREVIQQEPRLSIHDGFAFAVAENHQGCILVTGIDCSEPWQHATVSRFTACFGSQTRSISTGFGLQVISLQLCVSSSRTQW